MLHLQTTDAVLEDSQRSHEASHHTGIGRIIDIERYSDLSKLLLVSVYILRFIHKCKQHISIVRHTNPLQPTEIDQAAQVWIRYVQQPSFPTDFSALQSNTNKYCHLPMIRQLQLFLNSQQIICWGGKIHNPMLNKKPGFLACFPRNIH